MYNYSNQTSADLINYSAQIFNQFRQQTECCMCFVVQKVFSIKYCLCGYRASEVDELCTKIATCNDQEENKQPAISQEYDNFASAHNRRSGSLPNIEENLLRLLKQISSNKILQFTHNEKSARGLHNGISSRRSQFIGVLRNANRWQVLINYRGIKKYIGTYVSEKEAAIIHDFYSIGINGIKGKTNFSYDNELIERMINSYFENDKHFDASKFISQL